MLTQLKRLSVFFVVAAVIAVGLPTVPALADLSSCGATTSIHSVAPNTNTDIDFSIQNTDSSAIRWLRVIVPNSDFSMSTLNISGWSDNTGSTSTILTGGSVDPGDTLNFTIGVQAANASDPPTDWVIYASDDPGGGSLTSCTGTIDLELAGAIHYPLMVSNVGISTLTAHSVMVNWDTNLPATSELDYGLDNTYGGVTGPDPALVTSHSMTITGLDSATGYHYQALSSTNTESTYSGDNTFVTADEEAISAGGGIPDTSPATVSAPKKTVGGGAVTTLTGKPTETTPPDIQLTTVVRGAYHIAPVFAGTARDNDAISKVEYSTDGGKNWLPADNVTQTVVGTGKKATKSAGNVSFSFMPVGLDDGNYLVLARATDPSGNQASTAAQTLVIDRLPPRFGTSVLTLGGQMTMPAADGTLVLPAGEDFKMNVSLVGGPIKTTIHTEVGTEPVQNFTLTKSSESGLWIGLLSFKKAGRYGLVGDAVDGAGNHGSRTLATVQVVPPVTVSGAAGALKKAVATLYYLNPEGQRWQVWDAEAYGQHNPQPLTADHSFSLLMPPGKYYMKISVPGGIDTLTRSFSVDRPTPLSGKIALQEWSSFKLGPLSIPLPWPKLEAPPLAAEPAVSTKAKGDVRLPLVQLPTTSGGSVSAVDWYGKPTVLVTLATWAPLSAEQLGPLEQLSSNTDINVVPIAEQQRAETVAAYMHIAGRSLTAVADPDGLMSETLTAPGIPALYFIDRHGIIKKVMVGVKSADEILTELSHL